mmetsp:Transcript_15496/g.32407  ORF Transcript_15496/g.32407 Transcript_15496/m.32407 type:complete len:203 (-) Transcript_15496:261-869(-)
MDLERDVRGRAQAHGLDVVRAQHQVARGVLRSHDLADHLLVRLENTLVHRLDAAHKLSVRRVRERALVHVVQVVVVRGGGHAASLGRLLALGEAARSRHGLIVFEVTRLLVAHHIRRAQSPAHRQGHVLVEGHLVDRHCVLRQHLGLTRVHVLGHGGRDGEGVEVRLAERRDHLVRVLEHRARDPQSFNGHQGGRVVRRRVG